jgi:hypothetical protein
VSHRDKESLQQIEHDVSTNWTREQKTVILSPLPLFGPMPTVGDLPQTPFKVEEPAAMDGDQRGGSASLNTANHIQGVVVKGRVRSMEQPFFLPPPGGQFLHQMGLYSSRDLVDELFSPRHRQFQVSSSVSYLLTSLCEDFKKRIFGADAR